MTANDGLDHALDAWGKADFSALAGDSAAAARILAHASQLSATPSEPAAPPSAAASRRRPWWWAGGGAVAATLVAALVLGILPHHAPPPASPPPPAATLADADADDSELMSFAMLYTPTSEEEYQL